MKAYLLRRIIYAFITLYIIASLNFIIFQVISPIDPAYAMGGRNPLISPSQREAMQRLWGLDKPIFYRYLTYIVNMFTFNFGISFTQGVPVTQAMLPRLCNTIFLLGLSVTFNALVGVLVGILAASRRGSKLDKFLMSFSLFTWGAPIFYIQLLFVFFLANPSSVMIFPRGGKTSIPPPTDTFAYLIDLFYHVTLPLITLVITQFGWWAMYTRNMMLDILTEDYITTARVKGVREKMILFKHAFRATLPPFVTMATLIIPSLLFGSILTEYIFQYPGTGQWFLFSIENGDYPAAQALLFVYSAFTVVANLLVDFVYGVLDPRIRVGIRR